MLYLHIRTSPSYTQNLAHSLRPPRNLIDSQDRLNPCPSPLPLTVVLVSYDSCIQKYCVCLIALLCGPTVQRTVIIQLYSLHTLGKSLLHLNQVLLPHFTDDKTVAKVAPGLRCQLGAGWHPNPSLLVPGRYSGNMGCQAQGPLSNHTCPPQRCSAVLNYSLPPTNWVD